MIHAKRLSVLALILFAVASQSVATVYINRDYYWTGTEWLYNIVDRHYASGVSTWGVDTDFGQNGQGTPYILEADVYVADGARLNIDPGVSVRLFSGKGIYSAGTLNAQGTSDNPVVFTAASGTTPGTWDEICLYGVGAASSVLSYCEISYGGSRLYRTKGGFAHYAFGNVLAKDCSPTIDHVTSSYSGLAGLYTLGTCDPVVVDSVFQNSQYGIALSDGAYSGAQPDPLPIRGNTITGNAYAAWVLAQPAGAFDASNSVTGNTRNVMQIDGGLVKSAATWHKMQGNPVWLVYNDVNCPVGKSLTIDPGCVVKFDTNKSIAVAGTLTATGVPTDKITFTSLKDDSIGGDSNADGSATSPAKGDWGEVIFFSGSDASQMSHCVLRYGGCGRLASLQNVTHLQNGNLTFHNASPTITDCVSSDSKNDGAYLMTVSRPILSAVSFQNCTNWAINSIAPDSNAVLDACTATGCGRNAVKLPAGNMTGSRTWYSCLPYVVSASTSLDASGSLNVQPGSVIKFMGGAGLYLGGTVQAQGTADAKIHFTSFADDSVGGDTNGNGSATQPSGGDWSEVFLGGSACSGTLSHCVFRYGGDGYETSNGGVTHTADGNVYCYQAGPSFSYCEFAFSGADGVYLRESAASFASSTFAKNIRHGMQIAGSSDVLANSSLFSANGQFGIREMTADGAALTATYCNVDGLMQYQQSDSGSTWTWTTGVPTGSGNIAGDPVFVDAVAGNFGVKPPSPCVNAGDLLKTDPNGSRIDIGAYPYTGVWNPMSILTARNSPDGTEVLLTGKTATAGASALSNRIYVEDEERVGGLAIQSSTASSAGDRIYVTGVMSTVEGERVITSPTLSVVIPKCDVPAPFYLRIAALGGASENDDCPGIPGASGAYNLGLLVKITGKVTSLGTNCFWVSDGSMLADAPALVGVKVISNAMVSVGQKVSVSGISGAYSDDSVIRQVVRTRSSADVTALE